MLLTTQQQVLAMLNVNELTGFNISGKDLVTTYINSYTWNNSTTTFSIDIPKDAQSILIGHTDVNNGYVLMNVASITIDGLPLTKVFGYARTTEYTCDAGFWVLNNCGNIAGTTKTLTVTMGTSTGWGGYYGRLRLWTFNKRFNTIGYDGAGGDNVGSPAMTVTTNFYKGGFGAAVWSSGIGTASINYLDNTLDLGSGYIQCAAYKSPTVDSLSQTINAYINNANYNMNLCVVSFSPSRFID